ncbi:Rragb [Symbiodinium necroappetens]|uniref:Rragb protein n=1 Tax=Symbiodinium necroappetens TaxID=1628268 RepID=A0A812ZSF5_9DINO|nr:Rragb [Symbiodinium necroappetens]
MENYFESQRENIFQHCEVLIYVLVAVRDQHTQVDERKKDIEYFKAACDSLATHSPSAVTFALIHKLDLLHESKRMEVFKQYEKELLNLAPNRNLTCLPTSIWDDTLFKAWTKIVAVLVPDPQILQDHLDFMCQVLQADEIVIFEKNTFLVISHALTKSIQDSYRFEKLSNIIKQPQSHACDCHSEPRKSGFRTHSVSVSRTHMNGATGRGSQTDMHISNQL